MNQLLTFILIIYLIPNINSKCIWYEGIHSGYNELYLSGEPKPLPLNDIHLLNEICPHISTQRSSYVFLILIAIIF